MRRLTTAIFVERAKHVHASAPYDYSSTDYDRATIKVTIGCPIHGIFKQTPDAHLAGKGCPACRPAKASYSRKLKTPEFIQKSLLLHAGAGYDYAQVDCLGLERKVKIICPVHGPFWQKPRIHLLGCGCPACGLTRRGLASTHTLSEFVALSRQVHGDRYDYSVTIYTSAVCFVDIKCPVHGIFNQQTSSHLSGHGCPKCYTDRAGDSRRHTPESFVAKAAINGHNYKYNLDGYTNQLSKIAITCSKHGLFTQVAKRHLAGNGCPGCSSHASKGEDELYAWIKSLCPDTISRTRQIISPLELDVYIPSKNIAVEYNGMWYHSNVPGDRNAQGKRDYRKQQHCQQAGCTLFVVWEEDWINKRSVIEHWLRHKLGKSPRLCSARETIVANPSRSQADAFYARYHLQGPTLSSAMHIGLKWQDNWVAMASFTRSPERNVRLAAEDYYFARLAFAGSVPGAASKVFHALLLKTGANNVTAHSDNSYADGSVKRLLGFKPVGLLVPRYRVWHRKYGLRHRIFWQKSAIPKRLAELKIQTVFDPIKSTTFDGHRLCSCRHVWDYGKMRWLYKKVKA